MKIALDCDGVLANFYLEICRKFNRPVETIDDWEVPWIAENFNSIIDDYDFWVNLPILTHPEEISFEFDYYITSLPEHLKPAREEWLKKNKFPDKPVVISFEKEKTMLELGVDIIIDDKYQTIKEVSDSGLIGIHYLPYYFRQKQENHEHTIRNLHDVNEIVEKLKNNYTIKKEN